MSAMRNQAMAWVLAAATWSAAGADDLPWQSLFDGKFPVNFRAYKQINFPFNAWGARSGEIMAVPGNDRAALLTRDSYSNFEFSVEWRLAPGASSGIIYLVEEGPPKAVQAGLKLALADAENRPEARGNPLFQTGALYGLLPAVKAQPKPAGDWNESRIVVRTNHVEHWLNGEKVLEFDLGGAELKSAIRKSRLFKDLPDFGENTEGHIALEHNGTGASFRSLRIRVLPDPEKIPVAEPGKLEPATNAAPVSPIQP